MNQINPTLIGITAGKDVWGEKQNAILRLLIDQGNALDGAMAGKAGLASPAFSGAPTAPTPSADSNSGAIATTAFVAGAIAALVGGAPAALNALNELALALANDPNFASTISAQLGTKLTTPPGGTPGQVLTRTANGYAWTTLSGGSSGGGATVVDNGDGTFTVPGTATDDGDGTFTISGSTPTDAGDGTFTV